MYPNLDAELARKKITRTDLSKVLGLTPTTLSKKLNGKNEISLCECLKIKALLKVDITVDELFKRQDSA